MDDPRLDKPGIIRRGSRFDSRRPHVKMQPNVWMPVGNASYNGETGDDIVEGYPIIGVVSESDAAMAALPIRQHIDRMTLVADLVDFWHTRSFGVFLDTAAENWLIAHGFFSSKEDGDA